MVIKIKDLRMKWLAAGVAALGLLYGLSHYIGPGAHANGVPGGAMPPAPAKVQTLMESGAPVWSEYAGRLRAVDYVEIRPQVSGRIAAVKFEDGQDVKKGDVLLVIDPAPYEAAASQAEADLAGARSQSELAQKELGRAAELLRTDAISRTLMDQRENAAQVAKNNAASAEARLKQAKIDLDYAYVKAPISGRAGRAEITEGNLVQAGPNAPLLTSIVSNEGIYADFDVDEQTYLRHIRRAGQDLAAEQAIPVNLSLKGDDEKTYEGTIHSFDNRIDPASGTIRARALFKNDDGALLPGMFVTVKLGEADSGKKLLVSERAIGTDQERKFVLVVGAGNKVEYRPVKLGASVDGQRVVEEGLSAGEKVVTEGVMLKVRPDMVVAPQEEEIGTPAAPEDEILKKVETQE